MGNDPKEAPAIDAEVQQAIDVVVAKRGKPYAWACWSVAYDAWLTTEIERLAALHMPRELSRQIGVWANHLSWQRLHAEARAQGVLWPELAQDIANFGMDFHVMAAPEPKGMQ
jgi:hypothetical protein